MKTTLRLLLYIRNALRYPELATSFLGISERIAIEYTEQFGKMADAVQDLESGAAAIITMARGESEEIIKRFENLREVNNRVTAQLKQQLTKEETLSAKIKIQEKKIREIENDRKIMMKKYMDIVNEEVKDTTKCDTKVLQQFKLVQNEVFKWIRKLSFIFWFISSKSLRAIAYKMNAAV